MRTDVESGSSLADAMRKHPKAFDNLYVNMVAAGEAGGILDIILQRLSTYIEKVVKLNSQVKSALIYPVAVIVIAAGVVYIILWKVIPVFAQLFAGLGGEMPFLTRMVIGASNFLGRYFIFIFVADRRRLHRAPALPQDLPRPARHRRRRCSRSRSSACCCARSRWPASAAPWRP